MAIEGVDSYPLYWPEDWQRTKAHNRKASRYQVTLLGIAAPGLVPVPVLRAVVVDALEKIGLAELAIEFARVDPVDARPWRSIRTDSAIAAQVLDGVHRERYEIAGEIFRVCDIAIERLARKSLTTEHH
jgi:hypothetical protein